MLAGWVPPARLDPGLAVVVSLNPGAAGGLLTGWGPLLGAASLVGAGVLLVLGSSPTSPRHGLAVGLVAGGALANGLDRLRLGGVVDWLVLGDRLALNLADLALVVGVLLGVAAGWPGGTTRRERRG